jgi:DNA-binding NtrC family response regulator
VLLDLYLPDASGLGVLERLRQEGAAVILLARPGDIETAVNAMKLGAENVLAKPVEISQLAAAIARVREKARLSWQNARLLARVREMRSVLERSMTFARGPAAIGVEHVPGDLRPRTPSERRYHAHTLSEIERQHIERTLRHHGGNRTRAALELGISRATLINKIKAYSLNI